MARYPVSGSLRRSPDIAVHLDASDQVRLTIKGEELVVGREALLILDVFRYTIPSVIALTQLRELSKVARIPWEQIEATLKRFVTYGILCDGSGKLVPTRESSVESAPYHIAMLNDRSRTSAYLDAIQATVREGDVVLDIGTGTGVLAMGAARSGARRVYAIERGQIAGLAARMFEAFDNITLIRGSSHDVELPEKADVFVSELLGDEPLGEGLPSSANDAFKRHLKPGARCVPSHLKVFAVPLTLTSEQLAVWTLTDEMVARWREWYGLDYSVLLPEVGAANFIVHVFPQALREVALLAEPVVLLDLDLAQPIDASYQQMVTLKALRAGRANGLLLAMEVELSPGIVLSTHPHHATHDNHWRSPLWLHRDSFWLEAGDEFEVHAAYRVEWGRTRMGLHLPHPAPVE
ncbi:MAG: 50S ribosomal protein L11 methyltransferase [Armatimonadetes bacterium]|nr:50S ribosomal protein L11 methyltransferase [Armatimonadota bacterium]